MSFVRVSALVSVTTATLMGRVNDESRRAGSARFRTRVGAAARSPVLDVSEEVLLGRWLCPAPVCKGPWGRSKSIIIICS